MTDFKSELRKILEDLEWHDGGGITGALVRSTTSKAIEDIIALFISKLPGEKKPSDPKYNNKSHVPDEEEIAKECGEPFLNEDGELEHRTITIPNAIRIVRNYNDGWNQCLADIEKELE
jgi:hypothetical protein